MTDPGPADPGALGAVLDLTALLCLVLGAVLCLVAAIGVLRFPDLLSRQHAATKPQVLGVLLVLLAVVLAEPSLPVAIMAVLVAVFQLLTAPVASQMMSRAAVRTGQVDLGPVVADPCRRAPAPAGRRRGRRPPEGTDRAPVGTDRPPKGADGVGPAGPE